MNHLMKPDDQIKALAELDGREIAYGEFVDIRQRESDGEPEILGHVPFPDYLTSYDAIIPLIQKRGDYTQTKIEDFMLSQLKMFSVTPTQLCEALLRATGKWKDDE